MKKLNRNKTRKYFYTINHNRA